MKSRHIRYYSTNLRAPEVDFREALFKGLAPDGGLYMPLVIPRLEKAAIEKFSTMEYHEIACEVLKLFLTHDINSEHLAEICRDSYNFSVPVEKVCDRQFVLRLDQGPTASFKDFAARVMARILHYFISEESRHITILTATSGDTGSAVASAFHGLSNIDVIILFPAGEVSEIQRKQMTTLHQNVKVIALDGKFDDCQRLVKEAFGDPEFSNRNLTSANSINIGRLLPQSIYFFYAYSRIAQKPDHKVIFSVPSGNFGNLMGGIFAREMGLPVNKFIISTNSNNEVPEFLRTGTYSKISPSINCISSAMNVGHPSNLSRIISMYGGMMSEDGFMRKKPDIESMREDFYGVSITEDETVRTIRNCHDKYEVVLEPHGAVAWKGLEEYNMQPETSRDITSVVIETAHPAKFMREMKRILRISIPIPSALESALAGKEEFTEMNNDYSELKKYLLRFTE